MNLIPLDRIEKLDDGYRLEFEADPADPSFAGHFPQEPLLPAAAILCAMHAALSTSGVVSPTMGEVMRAKFVAPIRPGDQVTLSWKPSSTGWRISASVGETIAATAEFY